jgi:hypothetical protein
VRDEGLGLSNKIWSECECYHRKNYSASTHCSSEKSPFSDMKVAHTGRT